MSYPDLISEVIRLMTRPIIIFPALNILSLIISSIVLFHRLKKKLLRHIVTFLLTLIIILEIGCLIITNKFIGYELLLHFNVFDFVHMISFFDEVILVLMVMSIFFYYVLITSFSKYQILLNNLKKAHKIKKIPFITIEIITVSLSIYLMCGESSENVKGLLTKKIEAFRLMNGENHLPFLSSLKTLKMDDYVLKDEIIAKSIGKNIITISLESFETAFVNLPDPILTSYFQYISNNWKYIKINPNIGSNWTVGSIYSTMTGMPALFGLKHNSVFNNSVKSRLTTMSDIFEKINYQQIYICDNADFAGTRAMLNVLGFDKIIDKKQLRNKFDKDIFDAAKKEILNLEKSNNNYFLLISTLDTHAPFGQYDKRFKKLFPDLTGLEYSIAVLNFLLKDFVGFLESNNVLNNTIINIMPDHIFMGRPNFIGKNEQRDLFFISSSRSISKIETSKDRLFQLDIPKLILASADITHNVKFLTDYLDSNVDSIVKVEQNAIKSLNIAGFDRNKSNNDPINDLELLFNSDKSIFFAHAGGEINGDVYTNSLEALDYNYTLGVRYFELDFKETADKQLVAVHDWSEWAEGVGWGGEIPPSHNSFMSERILHKYTPLNIKLIEYWFNNHQDAILITDKINSPTLFSSIFPHHNRLIMELFQYDSIKAAINLGIDVLASEIVVEKLKFQQPYSKYFENIDYIAISQNYLLQNLQYVKILNQKGIKPIVFGMNDYFLNQGDESIIFNEKDFFNNYNYYIHGLYVDNFTHLLE
jgi:lipoteichoic acid synthase